MCLNFWAHYNPLTEKPKFFFTATAVKAKEQKSGDVEVGANYEIIVRDGEGVILTDIECKVVTADNAEKKITTDSQGLLSIEDVVPGGITIIPNMDEEKKS